MKIYDTAQRGLIDFEPADGKHVRMYTCGPTVYDYPHIGNLRTFVFEDILSRTLRYAGYAVTQVMNLTDVDDKTIRGAIAAGSSLDDFTATYKQAFFEDLETLRVQPADHYPAATDHIPEMIAMIESLIASDHAYVSDDGCVYFRIASYKGYGKLAHLDLDALKPGARVMHDEYDKDSVSDFALWKAWREADGDVAWDSPWGRGRPGWHIECSAMSIKFLGETFDLHCGGVDNIFPHHEDEIAQSECCTGKTFSRHWMHGNHLIVEGKKMSKSLGNFYTLRDILEKGHSPRAVRYLLISAHYRQQLNFTFDGLKQAAASIERIDTFQERIARTADATEASADCAWVLTARDAFRAALLDDLNLPEALAAVFDMVASGNRALDADDAGAAEAAAAQAAIADFDTVLGFLARDEVAVDAAAEALLEARTAARAEKDYAASDRIRDELAALGWVVKDTPAGPELHPKGAS